jgi:hypothetical protein
VKKEFVRCLLCCSKQQQQQKKAAHSTDAFFLLRRSLMRNRNFDATVRMNENALGDSKRGHALVHVYKSQSNRASV